MIQPEKKNKLLTISLLVLITVTVVVAFVYRADDTIELDKDMFRAADLKAIDEIRFTRKDDTIRLKYNGSSWVVNEQYRADPSMIQVLFATLQQAVPKRAISGVTKDSIIDVLKSNGTYVALLQAGTVRESFIAGGNQKKTAAYFVNPDDEGLYLMTIPGYRVYVSGVFELNESGFRDKYAFGFNWQNFKSLTAEFPGKPSESFTVAMRKDFFSIEGLPLTDTTRLYNYLDDVARLTVDGYQREAMTDTAKIVLRIMVTDIGSRKYDLKIFSSDNQEKIPGMLNGEAVYLSPARVRPLMKGKSSFTKKNQ